MLEFCPRPAGLVRLRLLSIEGPRLPRRGSLFAETPRRYPFSYSLAGPITPHRLAVPNSHRMSTYKHVAQLQQNEHLRRIPRNSRRMCTYKFIALKVPLE